MKRAIMGAGLGLLMLGAWGQASDDDLALVKRAVAAESQATPAKPEAVSPAPKAAKPGRQEPQWLKVRVVEKGNKKARVTINLPLALARALGDEVPIDWHCDHKCPATLKLSEVLAALEAGQSLVEIDDEETTVRIWVE